MIPSVEKEIEELEILAKNNYNEKCKSLGFLAKPDSEKNTV
jgi:hypothetical protein